MFMARDEGKHPFLNIPRAFSIKIDKSTIIVGNFNTSLSGLPTVKKSVMIELNERAASITWF